MRLTRPLQNRMAGLTSAALARQHCRKIVCIGRNYADHITELNNQRPKQPFFFLKPPSALLPPNGKPVLAPPEVDLHFEVELGLVIGRKLVDLDPRDEQTAMDAISSYVVAIDMTARSVQDEAKKKGLPWTTAKGFDTFCPISEIIPKAALPDPYAARLKLSVDGEVRQDDNVDLMLFRIPRILADISAVMTLEEGDVVLTGTPKGVGSVKPGQRMVAGISVGGKEIGEGKVDVGIELRKGRWGFRET